MTADLQLNINYLKFVGLWPAQGGATSWKHLLAGVVFFIGLASQALMLCSEVTDIIVNTNDLEQVTDGIFSAVMTFQGLFKQLYVSHNIKAFQQLVTCTESVFYKAKEPFKGEKEAIFRSSRLHINTVTVLISSICLAASFLYPFIPLTANFSTSDVTTNTSANRPLPYSVWLPVDKDQTPYHEMLYGITSINAISIGLYISSTDTFIICLIIHTFHQFDILQLVLRNLKADSAGHDRGTNTEVTNPMLLALQPDILEQSCGDEQDSDPERHRSKTLSGDGVTELHVHQERMQRTLRDCIQQHQRLLELSRTLNEAVSPFFLEQLATDVFILCTMALYVTVVPVMSFKFASALAILVCTLNILGLLSWCGGELSLKSEAVADAAYASDWTDASAGVKQSLGMLMVRASRPCRIKAGYLMDLNLASYFEVLKTSVSYFTVLWKLYRG